MRVSYSALETYKNCPLKFKYQILDKIKAPKSIETVFGALIHSTLKKMFERTPLFPALDELVDFFQNKWSFDSPDPDSEEIQKAYFEEGVSMLKNFYKKNPPWNFNAVELESRFEVPIRDDRRDETHILAGIIDRIDKPPENDVYEIIDYKTSKRMPSRDVLNRDLQLSIYGLGLLKKWPHLSPQNIKLSLYFLKHNEKIETKRTAQDLENTKEEIIKKINEIQELIDSKKEFIPTPSALCDWCGYKKICPMWKHQYQSQISNLKSQKDLEPIIKEYFALREQNSQNNKQIKVLQCSICDFMDQNAVERVFGENGYLTRVLQEREVFDTKKAKEILKNMGKLGDLLTKKQFSVLKASKKKIK